ncbi:MAG: ankyrin repeat domain-containing protein [Hydrococcus sp. RM1_1_31]|nr:ankyrin repeat domain-containing protein [Hydrococcus sp. RM1_1_31]
MRNRQLAIATLLSLALFSACGQSPEQARRELGELGIPYTPEGLQQAVVNKDKLAIDLFLLAGMNPSTALPEIVLQEDLETASKFLDNKADPNYGGGVPLLHAASEGNLEMAKLLLNKGAEPNVRANPYGFYTQSPLEAAAGKGHHEMVKLLLERGANSNDLDGKNSLALLKAIREDYIDVVKILLEKGANPNSVESEVNPFLGRLLQITAFEEAEDKPQILALLKQYSSKSLPQTQTENNTSSHTPSQ